MAGNGTPAQGANSIKEAILGLFGLFLLIGLVYGGYWAFHEIGSTVSGEKETEQIEQRAAEDSIQVSAMQLSKAYHANKVAADSQFRDKNLKLTGTVNNIGKDITDKIYLILDNGPGYQGPEIQCYFPDEATSQLAKITKGSKVTLIGKCTGYPLITVSVEGCTLVN